MTIVEPHLAGGRITIDLDALVSNWEQLAKLAGKAECAAVVKANAYGLGIEPVVAALIAAGCKTFFVAVPDEGIRVKNVSPSVDCYILNGLFPDAADDLVNAGLRPVLGTVQQIATWAETAKNSGQPLSCAIHMDSGMNRLGISEAELEKIVGDAEIMDHLDVQLFMTHYACADDIGHPKTEVQREAFLQCTHLLPGIRRSSANSAANLQTNGHSFDMVRSGIAMYGGEALNDVNNPMKPVVCLEGRIIQIQTGKAGDSVGYGGAETLKRDSRIAYLSVGYADGYHRNASNMGVGMRAVSPAAKAWFKGHIISGIGRISMDLCAFDVTDIPENEISEGDWIELFGPHIRVDDVARAAGTIGYELLTGLGSRYSRTYKKVGT